MATLQQIRKRGFIEGLTYGYWAGRCESIMRSMPVVSPRVWQKRILFVTSGKGLPYSVLDTAIIDSLRPLVQHLEVTVPNQEVVRHAEMCRPDLVIVFDGMHMSSDQVETLRKLGYKTAVWFADDPYYLDVTERLSVYYDYVFTLEINCLTFYQNAGCSNVYYLPLAVNPSVFRPLAVPRSQKHDLVFIGSAYWNRVRLFDRIAPFLAKKNISISGSWWKKRLRAYKMLKSKIEDNRWKSAEETATYYNGSRIVINVHRAHDDHTFNRNSQRIEAMSPNPRTFEIAACGVLQMTDIRSDLARFYEPGAEIVTFASPEELKSKIDYYLLHEDERREIALRGLARTHREHTYMHRLQQLLTFIFGPADFVL